ncbi:MAG: hypothetical protein WHX60_13710 [Armatimonadota bacterium]
MRVPKKASYPLKLIPEVKVGPFKVQASGLVLESPTAKPKTFGLR